VHKSPSVTTAIILRGDSTVVASVELVKLVRIVISETSILALKF